MALARVPMCTYTCLRGVNIRPRTLEWKWTRQIKLLTVQPQRGLFVLSGFKSKDDYQAASVTADLHVTLRCVKITDDAVCSFKVANSSIVYPVKQGYAAKLL